MAQAEGSKGQSRVRLSFNPNEIQVVAEIKVRTAELIDFCDHLAHDDEQVYGEKARLIALAQTAYEEASMWAVKAATYGV